MEQMEHSMPTKSVISTHWILTHVIIPVRCQCRSSIDREVGILISRHSSRTKAITRLRARTQNVTSVSRKEVGGKYE